MENTNAHRTIIPHENAFASSSSSPASTRSQSYDPRYDLFLQQRGPEVRNTLASDCYRLLLFYGFQLFRTCLPIIPHENEDPSSSSSTNQDNAPSSSMPPEIAGAPFSSSTNQDNAPSSSMPPEIAGAPFSSSTPYENTPSSSSTPRENAGAPSSSSTPHEDGNAYASSVVSTACSALTSYPDYDVFINHRGPDVKTSFATDLYHRLDHCGLRVFLDKPEMQGGLDIARQIKHAIETASIGIAIFSPTYAESSYCLDELHRMWKTCKSDRAIIIPVFYRVKPSEVRWPAKGPYGEALLSHKMKGRFNSQTIQDWEDALFHAAGISGFELEACNGKDEKLLDEVVGRILEIGHKRPLKYVTKPEFERTVLLQQRSSKAMVVGIVGPGGVGKTKLAQDFFNSKRSEYSGSCFLSDVKESSGISLQRTLIKDLTGLEVQIDTIDQGKDELKMHISRFCTSPCFHALIVLEDVDHADQMDGVLAVKDILGSNSLILVTSRDKQVLKRARISETSIYNLTGLYTPRPKTNFILGSDLFERLPSSLDQLRSLKELWLHDSPNLKCLSGPYGLLNRLRELNIVDCGIQSLSEDLVKMNLLEVFRVYNCPLGELSFRKVGDTVILLREAKFLGVSSKPSLQGVCPNLKHLWINSCRDLVKVGSLPKTLITLDLSYCNTLSEIQGLRDLARLEQLDISGCEDVEELPSLDTLKSLESLKVSRCYKLKSIKGLAELSTKLRRLYVRKCHEISELPGIEHCKSLKELDARDCPKLQWADGVLDQLHQRLKAGLVGYSGDGHGFGKSLIHMWK